MNAGHQIPRGESLFAQFPQEVEVGESEAEFMDRAFSFLHTFFKARAEERIEFIDALRQVEGAERVADGFRCLHFQTASSPYPMIEQWPN